MIRIQENNAEAGKQAIIANLIQNNAEKSPWLKAHGSGIVAHNFLAYADQQQIGGATGLVQYDWYFLELLQVDAAFQKQGVGRQLMQAVETFATDQHLTGIRLETWQFQARGFYEKLGYQVWGEIKDCPPGTITYCLEKRLISSES
ncbi:GNAT family N-acetyltransferase [Lapidilactobacillus wuchangensis]|uniref:GNAT family N-acetyltransferase n=1 Tax=Lapidilactobacillus wuchangensis TaxID=2486001 RepID=UPI000F78E611|nr:GNAT family N-acetyltransferase [Lapidilactobacillus wuchangensis]